MPDHQDISTYTEQLWSYILVSDRRPYPTSYPAIIGSSDMTGAAMGKIGMKGHRRKGNEVKRAHGGSGIECCELLWVSDPFIHGVGCLHTTCQHLFSTRQQVVGKPNPLCRMPAPSESAALILVASPGSLICLSLRGVPRWVTWEASFRPPLKLFCCGQVATSRVTLHGGYSVSDGSRADA